MNFCSKFLVSSCIASSIPACFGAESSSLFVVSLFSSWGALEDGLSVFIFGHTGKVDESSGGEMGWKGINNLYS